MNIHKWILIVLLLAGGTTSPQTIYGQSPVTLTERPFVVMYARGINQMTIGNYAAEMAKRLKVGESSVKGMQENGETLGIPDVEEPISGMLMYLAKGLIPSIEQVSFEAVKDEKDVRDLLEKRRKRWGEQATMEEDANGLFRIVNRWDYESEIQPDQKVVESTQEFPGYSYKTEIIERDGKRFMKQTGHNSEQYRYQDRLLYSNRGKTFSTLELPSSQDIFDSLEGDSDVGVKIYADRIPPGMKSLGWNMLNAAMGTQLQQRDNEATDWAAVRRSAGNWGLSLLKSAMFDLDYGEGAGFLAAGSKPVHGTLDLRTRRNSNFVKVLDEISSGRSRFAALLRDDAALSAHICLALPDEGKELFQATSKWIRSDSAQSGLTAELVAANQTIADGFDDIAEQGTLEVIARLVHSTASGSVILVGVQVQEQPDSDQKLKQIAEAFSSSVPESKVAIVQRYGRPIVHLQLGEIPDLPVAISDVWLTHREGCLWIAAGGENSHEMIRTAVDRCSNNGRSVRTRLLTAKVDMKHWTSWPQKDPTKLAQFPSWLDTSGGSLLLSYVSPFSGQFEIKPTPLLDRVMASKGSKVAWFTLDTDKAGIHAEGEIGPPLADWLFARQLDAQEQYMQQRQKQAEERAKEAAAKS